jgi:predicted PurR-regulated permease PerM
VASRLTRCCVPTTSARRLSFADGPHLTVSFPAATIVWIAFIIVWQRFEDYVVQPLVYGEALRVNPIVTIVSVLARASLLGILGALLAIPTAAAIQILLRDWWTHRQVRYPVVDDSGGATAPDHPLEVTGP